MKLRAFTSLCLFAALLCSAAPFQVAKGGASDVTIVLPQNADHVVKLAAEELQHWIAEISGAKLAIAPKANGRSITLDVTGEFPELKDNDGYAIRATDADFRIAASCPKGVLNGVYKILYKNTDILWARPDVEIGTVFSKTPDIVFDGAPVIDIPVFRQRGWQIECGAERAANSAWSARACTNWMTHPAFIDKYGCIKEFGGGHNICGLYLPESRYYKDHADFYPLIDGKRTRHSQMSNGTQLCFTNKEMTKEFIKRLDEFVQKNMQHTVFRVMLEDNYHLCTCPGCLAPITLPDGTVYDGSKLKSMSREWKVWRSTQFFMWFNQLAAFMKEKYPDKRLLSFAYFFTEYAPKLDIPDNVDISFCPIYRDSKHTIAEPQNKIVLDTVNEWLEKTKNVTWREYYGINCSYPRPIDRVAYFDYAFLAKKGMTKTYSEMAADTAARTFSVSVGTHVWDVGAPYLWSLAQAPWNPNRNVEDVRREFYTRAFGKAAAEVEAMYAVIEDAWYKNPKKSVWHDNPVHLWRLCYHKMDIDDAVRAHLDKAMALCDKTNGKKMLERFAARIDTTKAQSADAFTIPKAKAPVPMAADFTADVWKDAYATTDFYTEDKQPTAHPTKMYFLHDGKNLYAAMHAERKNLPALMDKSKNYCQSEVFNLFMQLTEEKFPDYFHIMVDPIGTIYASAGDNRQISTFKFRHVERMADNSWDCLIAVPLEQLPKQLRVNGFRRYNKHDRSGEWPLNGVGVKNATMHIVESLSPVTLGN